MTPGRLKASGTILLILSVTGFLASWSSSGADKFVYTMVNIGLFVLGAISLLLGLWRARSGQKSPVDGR